MSELPENWELVSLLEYVKFLPTGVEKYSGKIEYYSTGSIQDNIHTPEGSFTYEERPSRANRLSRLNDVFQARMKETNKGLLIAEALANTLFSTGFLQLRPYDNTYDNKLLFYYVRSKIFLDQRDELATGSTQEAITDTKAVDIQIPFPPLAEQRRIVAKLEPLLGKVDTCEMRLSKIPGILKRFRQSILAAACSGRLTADWRKDDSYENDLPADWQWIPIEELLPRGGIFDGPFGSNLKSSDYTDSGVRVVRLENVGHLKFIGEKESFVSREKHETLKKHTVGMGDIIFASFISEEIRVCLLPMLATKAIAKADCFCLRPKAEVVNRKYLTYQLVSRESYDKLVEEVHGATRPRINTTQLRKLEIRICPLPEQKEIVRRVEALFALADQIEARYTRAKAYVDKLTQSILAKAFRGELVSQDPNDEPASVLLERIREKRAKQVPKKRENAKIRKTRKKGGLR